MSTEAERPSITQFLQRQRKGMLHEELSDQLAAIVAGVMEHGKAGKLTLTLDVKPHGDDSITITDKYVAKVPTPPAKPSIYFADESGRYSRDRLDQPELPLREVRPDQEAAERRQEASA